ncbi:MAG: pyridoxal-phosphate dependent enzyme, partial [Actinobacteria bacterium]|nr:pyridoxal-phosphate dependent enzyme [Actinomycetota bacterium]
MNDRIELLQNEVSAKNLPPLFCKDNFTKVQAFHEAMPDYRETPLVCLSSLAAKLGVAGIYVKDESKRFGLNAFKALGAYYAIAQIMKDLKTEDIPVLVTTTDGNHGKA